MAEGRRIMKRVGESFNNATSRRLAEASAQKRLQRAQFRFEQSKSPIARPRPGAVIVSVER